MAGEIIYASDEGVEGGTLTIPPTFTRCYQQPPAGSVIVLGPSRYNIKSGGTYDKPLTIQGWRPRSKIYWIQHQPATRCFGLTQPDRQTPIETKRASYTGRDCKTSAYSESAKSSLMRSHVSLRQPPH